MASEIHTNTVPDQKALPDAAWLLALSRIPGIGNKTLLALLRSLGTGQAIWQTVLDTQGMLPGVRPAGSDAGDQKRIETPATAIANGADHIVVGRPIWKAADPRAAALAIQAELAGA